MPQNEIDLNRMRVFATVVEHSSFTVAADVLGVTTPKVSQQIAALETDLGVKLLERSKRALAPTEAGDTYYEACTRILEEARSVTAQLIENRERPSGRLRISAPSDVIADMVVPFLPSFVRHHAAISLDLQGMEEMPDFVKDRIDLAVRTHFVEPSRLNAIRVGDFEQVVCAAPSYLARRGLPAHPHDLRQHDCLAYGYLATGNQWKLTGPDGDHWIHIPWTLCSNNGEVLRDAVVKGRGIALLPTFIVGADLQEGSLRSILTDYTAPEISVYAIYPQTRHLSVKVRMFIDFLIERFGSPQYWDLVK
jgi:DNA-binding transcriptional LysR family regulator